MVFKMKMEIELLSKKNLPKKIIHDLTGIYSTTHICPFCKQYNFDTKGDYCYDIRNKWISIGEEGLFNFSPKICSPSKKFYWRLGLFYTKKYCSIPDYHYHYECKVCKAHWIVMNDAPYNPIAYID